MRVDTISIYASTRFCCSGACTLTCPANITVSNDPGVCGAVVTYPNPTETGNCGGVITSDHPSGELFPIGTTTVTLTDTRLDSSTATCTFTVTVNDTEFPVVSQPTNTPNILWPPNHQLVPVTIAVTTIDNDPAPVSRIYDVTANEPVVGPGSGNTSFDWQITGALTVDLRAERSGSGDGRIYTIHIECIDAAGNRSTGTVTVLVPHDQKQRSAGRR